MDEKLMALEGPINELLDYVRSMGDEDKDVFARAVDERGITTWEELSELLQYATE